jgi:hypothetical protein
MVTSHLQGIELLDAPLAPAAQQGAISPSAGTA